MSDSECNPRTVWCVQFDERNEWARTPALFSSEQRALEFVDRKSDWWQQDGHPKDQVVDQLKRTGEYSFFTDDADEEPYRITLYQVTIDAEV